VAERPVVEAHGDPEQAVNGPAGPVPVRRPASIRRTATMDMTWPGGMTEPLRIEGRARDAFTPAAGSPPETVGAARLEARIGADRTIEAIDATPRPDGIDELVGSRGGGHLRGALAEIVPEERRAGTPLYLLLDDLSGTSLIAGVAWSRWPLDEEVRRPRASGEQMAGVCIGFRPGSRALVEVEQDMRRQLRTRPVGPLVREDDPEGWHELPPLPDVSTRRARFIDVWLDDDVVMIDAGFQDSVGDPDHHRVGIHEYRLGATADRATLTLQSIDPDPRILPFRECPAAVDTASRLVGTPIADLRQTVLEQLARTNGCTHLNDAVRALAEVPVLVSALEDRLGSR
jgi:hypothetical protein